jgi:integrase
MTRREAHALDLCQLRRLFEEMNYPGRELALLAMLTKMNVAEICGLQWKYLNLSSVDRMVEREFIPPRTIAVRLQSYRGELSAVSGPRKRFVPIPTMLSSVLLNLRHRNRFVASQDFLLVSRTGTPIRPENAARRLKSLGRSCGMPWLTWSVFYQTRVRLKSELGRAFHEEFEKVIIASGFPSPD